jgi:hypothetical protein
VESKQGMKSDAKVIATERPWEPMRVTFIGDLAAVMRGKPGSKPDGTHGPKA